VLTAKKIIIWLPVIMLLLCAQKASAQAHSAEDTILLGAVIDPNGDTVGMIFLPEFELVAQLPRRYAQQKAYDDQLRYNVYKVYPYAVIAADILKDVDVNLAKLPDKRARKEYLKSVEKQLNGRFKGELENLSITQGQILVRLIDRQTGKNCFSIIQQLKGGFSAVIWQSVALLFSNNLRREYDPAGRDKDIEKIVQELEAANYYHYHYDHQSHLPLSSSR
jgi:hypothetical protein